MTCVLAYTDGKTSHMIADSCAFNMCQYTKHPRKDKKIYPILGKCENAYLGFTSSYRMGQILSKTTFDYKTITFETLLDHYIPKCITRFKNGCYDDKGNDGGNFIIIQKGSLFEIDSDYQIAEPARNYTAVGCGEHFVMASFETLLRSGRTDIKNMMLEALQVTIEFSAFVGAPFHYINTKDNKLITIEK